LRKPSVNSARRFEKNRLELRTVFPKPSLNLISDAFS